MAERRRCDTVATVFIFHYSTTGKIKEITCKIVILLNYYLVFNYFIFALENSPSDAMSNPTSLPPLNEGYGRKRKKRTSIETNIKLTLEKRFLDVSSTLKYKYLTHFYRVKSE